MNWLLVILVLFVLTDQSVIPPEKLLNYQQDIAPFKTCMKKCIIEESSFITNKSVIKHAKMQRSYEGVILIKYAGTKEAKCIKCVTYTSLRDRFQNAADGRHVQQTLTFMVNDANPCKPDKNRVCNFLIYLETPTAQSTSLHDTIEYKSLSYLIEKTNGYPSQKCRFVSRNIQYEIKVTLKFQTDYDSSVYECSSISTQSNNRRKEHMNILKWSSHTRQRHKAIYKQHVIDDTDIKIPQLDLRVKDIADDNKDEKDDSKYISNTRGLIIAIAPFCVLVLVIYICACFSRGNCKKKGNLKKKVNILKTHGSGHATLVQNKIEEVLSKSKFEPVVITGDEGDQAHLENQTIVLCVNDSRLKDDIDGVLHKIENYCKDNIIVIVIHFKQDDYSEYGDSEKKVKGLVAKILDWDVRRVPQFDNELTLSDLQVFLKSTFETKQCCKIPECCKTFDFRTILDAMMTCKCKCSDKK